ncbi:hypothetical protein SAMN05444358_11813 [Ruegeria halocynthiae]|uniref:Uncharacterized protein n=1 Tax=Ruegeria halocynthiae TaxID=985054 RepID=A0A1H3FTI6_9RHOB|nr:hypothetical protein [Ruegeria halocynthiae]SDX94261.1 hypothetical protein SAMN05444358_11813 [Ruegeria halocynthiae]
MIKVLMFDLGGTLARNRVLLPHAAASVAACGSFITKDGSPLESCLVSDFVLADPFESDKVVAIFSEYLQILTTLGLRDLFQPVERRVTLSTHANIMKPDRRVFELALERLGSTATLTECLFITENAGHIAAARALGMMCLQFGIDGPDGFTDWADGLLKIALNIDPAGIENITTALGVLGDAEGLAEIQHVAVDGNVVSAEAQALVTLDDSSLGELDGLHVQMPAKIKLDLQRPKPKVQVQTPEDAKTEATAFVRSLQAHGKLGGRSSLLGPPTHEVETDTVGRRILRRKGFD